ncbi:MAG: sulfite exporter TauE/SafE family protein, partial [Devosia sp.]|nr:sulfite exporter TauE/SafE family protein [Devosia sp.]
MTQLLAYWPLVLGLSITGMVSGVFAGLLGVGGGTIIVPALAFAFAALGIGDDVAQHVAVASSLAIIIPTGIMSARAHNKRGAVDADVLRL